jgi:hypothetical protein
MKFFLKYYDKFILIGVIIMFIIIYLASKSKRFSLFDRFVDKIKIITGIFIAIGVILTAEVFRRNLEQLSTDTTLKVIDRGWIKINEEILKYYNYCPKFIDSLYYDWQKEKLTNNIHNTGEQDNDKWYAVNYLSVLIFQSMEDFLTTFNVDETGNYVWITNFLQWCKSPILQNIWLVQKPNYADNTKNFVDLLFKNVEKYNIKNEFELTKLGKQIEKSNAMQQILENRNKLKSF